MAHSHPSSDHDENSLHQESWLFSRTGLVTIGAVGILGFLVYSGHSAHLLGFVPYLFILACPLMHIFMHGGHHHRNHGSRRHDDNNEKPTQPSKGEPS